MNIVLFVALGALLVAVFVMLNAAELLKGAAEKDLSAEAARYHSKVTGFTAAVLVVIGCVVAENSNNNPWVSWVPYVLFLLAGMLIVSWWFVYRPTVAKHEKQQAGQKK